MGRNQHNSDYKTINFISTYIPLTDILKVGVSSLGLPERLILERTMALTLHLQSRIMAFSTMALSIVLALTYRH
jgi:hypothetical protein